MGVIRYVSSCLKVKTNIMFNFYVLQDPSVHTLAPITILANYDKTKSTGCKTELDDLVHAK